MSSDIELCGFICKAAQRLGIYGKFHKDHFFWCDHRNGGPSIYIKCPSGMGRGNILIKACKTLQDYFNGSRSCLQSNLD